MKCCIILIVCYLLDFEAHIDKIQLITSMAQWQISLNVLNCGGLAPHRTSDPRVVGSIPTNVVLARSVLDCSHACTGRCPGIPG